MAKKIKSSYDYLAEADQVAAFEERNAGLNHLGQRNRERTKSPDNKYGVVSKLVDIYSDNVRMQGTLWKPVEALEAPDASYPAVLLCHGWGGIRDHLDARFGFEFAKAGFIVLTFDYRGWNDSDGVVSATGSKETQEAFRSVGKKDLENMKEAALKGVVIRETVDMEWQLTDIQAAFHYLDGEPVVDSSRIGLWGISQGGGHVISMGAKLKSRVKAIVAQVPSCGDVGAGAPRSRIEEARQYAIARARGTSGLPQSVPKFHLDGMDGNPVLSKLCVYSPLDTAHLIECPLYVIDAEGEEMFDRNKNGKRAYEIAKVKNPDSQYTVLPGKHYDAYDGSLNQFAKGTQLIIEFYKKVLGTPKTAKL